MRESLISVGFALRCRCRLICTNSESDLSSTEYTLSLIQLLVIASNPLRCF